MDDTPGKSSRRKRKTSSLLSWLRKNCYIAEWIEAGIATALVLFGIVYWALEIEFKQRQNDKTIKILIQVIQQINQKLEEVETCNSQRDSTKMIYRQDLLEQ